MSGTAAVVFNLDGTLADTLAIPIGERTPAEILGRAPAGRQPPPFEFSPGISRLPGRLLAAGYRVAVVTRSTADYASTLLALLAIDFEVLLTNVFRPQLALLRLIQDWQLQPEQFLYIGDTDADRQAALRAGTWYAPRPRWSEGRVWPAGFTTHRTTPLDMPPLEWLLPTHVWRTLLRSGDLPVTLLDQIPSFDDRVRVAASALSQSPGMRSRRALQYVILHGSPPEAIPCLLPTPLSPLRPTVPPWLVTRAEYDADVDLRATLLMAMTRWFRTQRPQPTGNLPPQLDVQAAVSFWNSPWGFSLWGLVKDWQQSRGSGPRVHLGHLELPALALAAHARALGVASVVPVPPTVYSPEKPAQTSLRLAARVAEIAGLDLCDVLRKTPDGTRVLPVPVPPRPPIVLIDDQYTTGGSIARAVRALQQAGMPPRVALTWSSSHPRRSRPSTTCWLSHGYYGMPCRTHGNPDIR